MTSETEFWFNTKTREVEEGKRSSWENLMGPYATRAEAEKALEQAAKRTDDWDAQDDRWR
ncbi:MAG: SPOR domain-containing protein [Demequina sp.]|uniref:SPOR domain-containing protein n=1 Tax=Demequina sp. TaxID=2050685 RepID=UPI003A897B61